MENPKIISILALVVLVAPNFLAPVAAIECYVCFYGYFRNTALDIENNFNKHLKLGDNSKGCLGGPSATVKFPDDHVCVSADGISSRSSRFFIRTGMKGPATTGCSQRKRANDPEKYIDRLFQIDKTGETGRLFGEHLSNIELCFCDKDKCNTKGAIFKTRKCHSCYYSQNYATIMDEIDTTLHYWGKNSTVKDCKESPGPQKNFENGEVCVTADVTFAPSQPMFLRTGMLGPTEKKCETVNPRNSISERKLLDDLFQGYENGGSNAINLVAAIDNAKLCYCLEDGCNNQGQIGSSQNGMTLIPTRILILSFLFFLLTVATVIDYQI